VPPQEQSRYIVHREDEYDALVNASGIVVLHGPPRCGKTTLLKKLAEDDHGAYFEFYRSDLPEFILIRLAEAMGKHPRVAQTVAEGLQQVTKSLADLVKAGDVVEVITTQRRHIFEQFFDLLAKAQTPIYLDGIREVAYKQDILDLVWDLLGRTPATIVLGIRDETRVELDLNEHIPDDAAFVCLGPFTKEQTEELVRGKYEGWDPEVHERWEGDPGRLYLAMAEAQTLDDLLTKIPRTLADQYHGAYTKLTPNQRRCADLLAVLGEPVSLTDLAAILETDRTKLDLSPAIFVVQAAEARLYHPTCAEYVHEMELKGDSEHHRDLHLRAAQFYVKHSETTDREPRSIEDIRNALRAREHFHEAGEHHEAAHIFNAVAEKLHRWGHWHLLARIGEESIVATDPPTRADALHCAGIAQQSLGNYAEAERYYDESLEIKRELDDRAGIAATLLQLGILQYLEGNYADAHRYYENSLAMARELRDRAAIATSLHQLGMIHQRQGKYAEAQCFYEDSLHIKRELGNRTGIAMTLHQLGNLQYLQGNYADAQRYYENSLEIERELDNRAGIAITLHQLGHLQYLQGNYAEACRHYGESLEIKRELGNRPGIAMSLYAMAVLSARMGLPETAALAMCAASRLMDEMGMAEREEARTDCRRIAELIDPQRFSHIDAEAERMSLDQVIDRVLQELKDLGQ